jgi:oligopeptide/dipeptide ABC transporter ATP-binding protein
VKVGEQILEALNSETYDAWRAGPARGLLRYVRNRIWPDRESEQAVHREAIRLLESVHMPDPAMRFSEYPYMLSGGMLQRVMIVIALAGGPRVLIADEPTTALDVTMEAQILRILRERKEQLRLSTILITHDLGVIAEVCDRVVVMYAGRVVEEARCRDIFESPSHPYTTALLASVPRLDEDRDRLEVIEGAVPDLIGLPTRACHFHPRCPFATDICRTMMPPATHLPSGQTVRCHLYSHPAMRVPPHELTPAHPKALSRIEPEGLARARSS